MVCCGWSLTHPTCVIQESRSDEPKCPAKFAGDANRETPSRAMLLGAFLPESHLPLNDFWEAEILDLLMGGGTTRSEMRFGVRIIRG